MDRQEHLRIDRFLWDKEYEDVHKWLDEFFDPRNLTHWKTRHHIKAIEEEYGSFTIKYNVAYVHILIDWLSHHQIAVVPKNEEEVIELMKSLGI